VNCAIPIPPSPTASEEQWTSELFDYQREFVACDKRIQLAMWGVATGKTLTGCVKLLRYMLEYPGLWAMHISPTYPMFYENVYPILDHIDDLWRQLYGFHLITKWHKGNNQWFRLFNGSTCFVKSGEHPDRIRGQTVGVLWIDELAAMDADVAVFERSLARLRGRGPRICFITSTPQGDTGALGHILQRVKDLDPDYWMSREGTAANTTLDPGYLLTLKSLYSEEFWRQEVLAEPIKALGLVYPEFGRTTHITDFRLSHAQMGIYQVIVGVDWGYSHAHAVWIAVKPAKGAGYPDMVVFDEIGLDNQSDLHLIEAMLDRISKHGVIPRAFCPDPAGVEGIKELRRYLAKRGLHCRVAIEPDVQRRRIKRSVELVRRGLRTADGQTRLLFDRGLLTNGLNDNSKNGVIQSIEHYRRKVGEGKTYKAEPHDDNFYTHAMDALRYPILTLPHLGYSMLPAGAPDSPRGAPMEAG
jgi:hypothetical protein